MIMSMNICGPTANHELHQYDRRMTPAAPGKGLRPTVHRISAPQPWAAYSQQPEMLKQQQHSTCLGRRLLSHSCHWHHTRLMCANPLPPTAQPLPIAQPGLFPAPWRCHAQMAAVWPAGPLPMMASLTRCMLPVEEARRLRTERVLLLLSLETRLCRSAAKERRLVVAHKTRLCINRLAPKSKMTQGMRINRRKRPRRRPRLRPSMR